jgi:aspartyl-tRNA(Asn)/glutamyl-tRNA(Gln) amidotransferase subunit B
MFQNVSTADLANIVQQVIDANLSVAADFKSGKDAALEYLVGQSMKMLKGVGDPNMLRSLLKEKLQ